MQALRSLSFALKGMWGFTKGGFESHKKSFDPNSLNVDITEKVFLITGANSGLGYVTALAIAKKGGKVHIICRNPEKGKKALEELKEKSKNDNIFLHVCDVSLQNDIIDFVKNFSVDRIDVLINNAGILPNKTEKTKEGVEITFATNTIGTFLLTELLIPKLIENKKQNPRVITISSGGMYTQKLSNDYQFETMKPFDGTIAYAFTKRQQVILNEIWAAKYPEISFYSMHPGWSDTEGVRSSLPSFKEKMGSYLRTPEEGADTIIWLAIANDKKMKTGKFYFDREEVETHLTLGFTQETEQERKDLYEYCKKISKL